MNPPDSSASWDSVARAAGAPARDAESADEQDLLCFEVDGQPYAVPIEAVREIVRLGPVTPIPRVDRAVLGVISLRGEMLQLIDLRLRLGVAKAEPGPRARILVISNEDGRSAGLLVDAVREVLRVAEDAIGPPPGGEASGLVCGLCARGESFVSLVDLEKALDLDGGR